MCGCEEGYAGINSPCVASSYSFEDVNSSTYSSNFIYIQFNESGSSNQWAQRSAFGGYSGAYALCSNSMFYNSNSTMIIHINMPADGTVSFYLKGTCEEHDELNVYYDGENWISSRNFYTGSKTTGWSSWTSQSVDLSAGNHTLTFNYRKDNETNGGDDRFCIDDLSLSFD